MSHRSASRHFSTVTWQSDLPWLVGMVLVAAALRFSRIDHSLWLDELHSAWTVGGTVSEIAPRAQMGNVGPLYFYGVWAVTRLVGFHEVGLRLLSLLAGVALVPLSYWAILRLTATRAAALMAALLVAVDHTCIYYAQNARPYAVVQALALVHIVLFATLIEQPSLPRRIAFIVITATMFYLHYTSLLLVTGEVAYYAIHRLLATRTPPYRVGHLAFDLGCAAVMCLPAGGHLAEIAARRGNWAAFVPRQGIQGVVTLYPLAEYLLWPLMAATFLACWYRFWPTRMVAAKGTSVDQEPQLLRTIVLMACVFLVPLFVAWCLTWTDMARLFARRYTVVVFAALPLASACVWASLTRRSLRVLYLIVLFVGVQMNDGVARNLVEIGRVSRHGQEDWRGAVEWVNLRSREVSQERARVGRPVFVRSGLIESDALTYDDSPELREYCLFPVSSMYRLTGDHRVVVPLPRTDAGNLNDEQIATVQQSGGAWFILRGPPQIIDRFVTRLTARFAERGIEINVVERRAYDRITVIEVAVDAIDK